MVVGSLVEVEATVDVLRGLSGAGEEVPLRAARGGGEMKVLGVVMGPLFAVVLLLGPAWRVLVGEVRGARVGERRPLMLLVPVPVPAPGAGRRFSGEGGMVLRGLCMDMES